MSVSVSKANWTMHRPKGVESSKFLLMSLCSILTITLSMRETEINERLQDTYHKLLQAGADRRENERETRLKETLASLKRIFPGVHGRVVDLCRPVATKYDTAVMTVLGKNIDAVVVEHEKVAIDCIEVIFFTAHTNFWELLTLRLVHAESTNRTSYFHPS